MDMTPVAARGIRYQANTLSHTQARAMSAACPEYGFELTFHLVPRLAEDARSALWDAFIDAVEARGLSAGGGGDQVWRLVITRDGGQAIDADREALGAWAAARPEIAAVGVGPLVDLSEPGAI